jgi:hypothetical protein
VDKGAYRKEGWGRRMNNKRQNEIIETLFDNAGRICFGQVSVELKIHEGRLVAVTYSSTENSRQKEKGDGINAPM